MNDSKSKNPWIAGLISFAIHTMLLLVMAIWTIAGTGTGGRLTIDSGLSTEDAEDSVSLESVVLDSRNDDEVTQSGIEPQEISSSIIASDVQPTIAVLPDNLSQTPESLSDSIRSSAGNGSVSATTFVNSSLEGRISKNRASIGARNGATAASEDAVEAALAYLARHQRNNGSWTVRLEDGPCQGECDHGGTDLDPHEIAATGLALLCFMGAGHTMHAGEYSDQVSRGIYFLIQNLKIQSARGTWLTSVAKSEMYEHGIATLAICEALQMTGDASLSESCQAAVNQIIYAQHSAGGWGYRPKLPGDLSIVGWQVLALKSAFAAKLNVNADTIRLVDRFLNQHSKGEFMYVYNIGFKPTTSMTAIGTLMRIFRGRPKTDPTIIRAIDYLAKEGPSSADVYCNYYATQVLFQCGGKPWKDWNKVMREYLINTQEKNGHMAGSWWYQVNDGDPLVKIANQAGGRLYVTAMNCLTLEVYYRYLPVNEAVTIDFQF